MSIILKKISKYLTVSLFPLSLELERSLGLSKKNKLTTNYN